MTARLSSAAAALALLGATLVGSVAVAEQGKHGNRGAMLFELFDSLDSDADGLVTQAELDAHRAAMFTAADTNSDGALDAEELAARQLARFNDRLADRTARMIEARDANGDGLLQPEEMADGPSGRMLARIDTDNDGAISLAEAEAAVGYMQKQRKHRGGWMGMED